MQRIHTVVVVFLSIAVPALAAERDAVTGEYVEARTAEVFTGGCVMGSEAETVGRQAVLAWRVAQGSFDGVRLDGLTVVAAVVGDRNLGIREIGGEAPTEVKATLLIDDRADQSQRAALVSMVKASTGSLIGGIVETKAVPIRFARRANRVEVDAGDAVLTVQTDMKHDMNCGAMQWFHPLASTSTVAVAMTRAQAYNGRALGSRWQQVDKKSAFFGTFTLAVPASE
jgi:hypothetical protein